MTARNPRPVTVTSWSWARLLVLAAVVFFTLAAMLAGGMITGDGLGWLTDAGLACLALAFAVP